MALYQNVPLYRAFFEPSRELRAAIDSLEGSHRASRAAPKRVLDPACGVGLWLEHFVARGSAVAGVEIDAGVAEQTAARLRGKNAVVVHGDMREPPPALASAPFDLAINLDNSVGHLGGVSDLVQHLQAMHRLLGPRGLYLLGVAVREAGETVDIGTIYERGPLPIEGGGFAAILSETHGLFSPDDTGGLRCERIRHYILTAGVANTAPFSVEQYDLLTFPHALLYQALAAGGPWTILDCRDASDESLPSRRFKAGCGDVLLVLQPAKPATASGGAKTKKLIRRKRSG